MHLGIAFAKRTKMIGTGLIGLILLWQPIIHAHETTGCQALVIADASLSKVPPGSQSAALYMTITNHGDQQVNLLGMTTPVARHTMFHKTQLIDGVAKMQHLEKIGIQPGQRLEFKPGGLHLMLMGINNDLLAQARAQKKLSVGLKCESDDSVVTRNLNIK